MKNGMTPEQLGAVLDALPVELAFIDEKDNLRFWNREAGRDSAWQASCLDSAVQACHQEKSRIAVNGIICKLRNGQKNVVDRVIRGTEEVKRFRWFAIRGEAGEYLGTLEMVQQGSEVVGRK